MHDSLQVAIKLAISGIGGAVTTHLVFGTPFSPALALGAMLPSLASLLLAARQANNSKA